MDVHAALSQWAHAFTDVQAVLLQFAQADSQEQAVLLQCAHADSQLHPDLLQLAQAFTLLHATYWSQCDVQLYFSTQLPQLFGSHSEEQLGKHP